MLTVKHTKQFSDAELENIGIEQSEIERVKTANATFNSAIADMVADKSDELEELRRKKATLSKTLKQLQKDRQSLERQRQHYLPAKERLSKMCPEERKQAILHIFTNDWLFPDNGDYLFRQIIDNWQETALDKNLLVLEEHINEITQDLQKTVSQIASILDDKKVMNRCKRWSEMTASGFCMGDKVISTRPPKSTPKKTVSPNCPRHGHTVRWAGSGK